MQSLTFKDSKSATARPDFYMDVKLDVQKLLKSWQLSVFSFEWIEKDGKIKAYDALKDSDQEKQKAVLEALQNQEPLEKPVLGIGIQDNVEIGSGKAMLCTLAGKGVTTIPAHIPKSNESDFKAFLADVS